MAQLGKLEKKHPGLIDFVLEKTESSENENFEDFLVTKVEGLLREKSFYENHVAGKNLQREAFKKEVDDLKQNLAGDKAIVILDFKQNVCLNGALIEFGRDFFERSQRTILGFVILTSGDNGGIKKTFVNFVSELLNHDALFVSDCMKILVDLDILKSRKHVSFWTDAGPHFRCGEFANCIFDTLFSKSDFSTVSWNLFVEKHGKNLCDTHFSALSKWLKAAEKENPIKTTDDLIKGWENEIRKDNFVLGKTGKPKIEVIFKKIDRRVRPKVKHVVQIPTIKSFYSFGRTRGDGFLLVKTYTSDSCVRKVDVDKISSKVVRTNKQKLRRAPKFPVHTPHFSSQQINVQKKGIAFRLHTSENSKENSGFSQLFSAPLSSGDISSLRARSKKVFHNSVKPNRPLRKKRRSVACSTSSKMQPVAKPVSTRTRKRSAPISQHTPPKKICARSNLPNFVENHTFLPPVKSRQKRKSISTATRICTRSLSVKSAKRVKKSHKNPKKSLKRTRESSKLLGPEMGMNKIMKLSRGQKRKQNIISSSSGEGEVQNVTKRQKVSRFQTRSRRSVHFSLENSF